MHKGMAMGGLTWGITFFEWEGGGVGGGVFLQGTGV